MQTLTPTTVDEVFAAFQDAPSNSEKGTAFEKLMVEYFQLDPVLSMKYEHVSRWIDWAHRGTSVDVGIDLVARDRDEGSWTAIQCKFFNPDHYLSKGDIDSFFTASGKTYDGVGFTNRIIISTTDHWSSHAEEALQDQSIPVQRIGSTDIASAPIDWAFAMPGTLQVELAPARKYATRPHQDEAIGKILTGFEKHDRGQWISACGTGKTFTSLKLAERLAEANGGSLRVLFLAPSIQLVSQTLREWTAQTTIDMRPFVVCSDTKVSRAAEDISVHDVVLPATTNGHELYDRLHKGRRAHGMSVVFSTYQSIDTVAKAQELGAAEFDLILCDEAHRTTGVTLADASESSFVKVHDQSFLAGKRRLYMTATPRMFGEETKGKAAEHSAELTSMDDPAKFGPVFHRLGFGEAVERDLLSDYKVMVLMVSEEQMAAPLQEMLAGEDHEIPLDDAAKIIGCWNGLAKRTKKTKDHPGFPTGAIPMKRAVAFLGNIKSSKRVAEVFPQMVETAEGIDSRDTLLVEAEHVDGTMNALERAHKLSWLKAPVADGQCRILTNARCLSEGVDVPALDAVLFMSPRSSQVDVVQSVGRVMRKAPDKEYGYIILPVAVPAGSEPDKALNDNRRFKVVWDVLNALRAHDDRFDAMINSIQLNKNSADKIITDVIDTPDSSGTGSDGISDAIQDALFTLGQWRDSLYARIVTKVGTREYWDQWAKDVADMSAAQVTRINAILDTTTDPAVPDAFDQFLHGLRANLNESISRDDAISMLSQHLITAPVFDALFGESSFAMHNPVSVSMQDMLDVLEDQGLDAETEKLDRFYDSVRTRAASVKSAEGRQSVIHDLYEKFFRNAFPKQAQSLGVVYTPVEIVDFILRAADDVCRQEFGHGLTDEGVKILDPFTGTGTFIVRLLQSGIIQPEDLARKYASELWANEIMLLAYYIACVNIETTYQALIDATDYTPFPGAVLTDTFQSSETGDRADTSLIPVNNERIQRQIEDEITVIVGNPPYSVGQTSANDNNANYKYETLDGSIADTYARRSSATNKNSLYDSYIRAFRWATDRLGPKGVVAFVSNGGWIDGNTADGMRLSLANEYSTIYVYNLRGNQRTAGELSKKEGGKVFGSGSRNTVAIFIGVKDPTYTGSCRIQYHDIGDYLTREQKLQRVDQAQLDTLPWQTITPNTHGDWTNHRDDTFLSFMPIVSDGPTQGVFELSSNGLKTNRDAWCYNFSETWLRMNMQSMIDAYNSSVEHGRVDDPRRISWSGGLDRDLKRGRRHTFEASRTRRSLYRPFSQMHAYFDATVNERTYQMQRMFPTAHTPNVGFYALAPGSPKPFSVLGTDRLPDLAMYGSNSGQFYPRWTYVPGAKRVESDMLFDPDHEVIDGYQRIDNITDAALAIYRHSFGTSVTKDDIFAYVYGVLHSPQYRQRFAADLTKMLPRVPLAAGSEDFRAFVDAGAALVALHVGYETVEPYPLEELVSPGADLDDYELFAVGAKMKFQGSGKSVDKSTLIYNSHVTLRGMPDEAHRYQLGSRSALEWIIDRYWVRTDKASGIVNDPNAWSREQGDPRYIIDLVKRVVTVSVETMKIVDSLPDLVLED
ncbi:DEAD/DEAH box helicase [Tessaracoccus sp. MC1679]|uniref:DEAD/DEAH box helicase n=1 Tax=Tessaracoccus sp. MC1679 TaxID=2760313 RepID=UPI0016000FB1|nr:DEAD/DEAH box helicase [Tessaracoccus sp. MC1679]MBB1517474.1 DEAD/DEAH box helicase [Tessaracoccus sp. MC1679]